MIYGGLQERSLRSGTENVAAIAGFGKACEIARSEVEAEGIRLRCLRDTLQRLITEGLPGTLVNGQSVKRLPHVLSVSAAGVAGEDMVREMDKVGVAVSSGSACTSNAVEISHVLTAMGLPVEMARGTVRFSLGRGNTQEDVECAADAFIKTAAKLRALSEIEGSLANRRCF
jgi:cysteine desulfurase